MLVDACSMQEWSECVLMKKQEWACKPGSVENDHLSRTLVSQRL